MDEKYERGFVRITAVLLLVAALLIPLDPLGVGASPLLPVAFAVLAAALYVAWQRTETYDMYLSGMWLGPTIAALLSVYGLTIGASPGELQALGGMAGLAGVVNLLLRPVYRLVHYVIAGAIQIGREIQEERRSS
jgi:hypothetical protein